MLTEIELKQFKCFEHLTLPLRPLTVLSGVNASGKSSVIQALLLLHQTTQAEKYAKHLILNGSAVNLGTTLDVVNKASGRDTIEIGLRAQYDEHEARFGWCFQDEKRDQMSMPIVSFQGADGTVWKREDFISLTYLFPHSIGRIEVGRAQGTEDFVVEVLRSIFSGGVAYLSAERAGPRDIYSLNDDALYIPMAPDGENAAGIYFTSKDKKVLQELCIAEIAPTFARQVEAWMGRFFPGFAMEVDRIPDTNCVTLGIRTSGETGLLRPANTGFGVTQVMPLIIAALSLKKDDLLLVENPEVHLHPAGQAEMGRFLSQVAKAGVQVIVETHSDHVLNGIRRAVKGKVLPCTDVALHFFGGDKSKSQVESLAMNDQGSIDYWPSGFFDQFDKDAAHFAGWD
ncbi:MAG: DUF3696 domain-containing protein [Gammaproteobacteria bacterium]